MWFPASSLGVAFLFLTAAAGTPPSNVYVLPKFAYKAAAGSSSFDHFDFGKQLGSRFAASIRHRLNNSRLQGTLLPFLATARGQQVYRDFFAAHNR